MDPIFDPFLTTFGQKRGQKMTPFLAILGQNAPSARLTISGASQKGVPIFGSFLGQKWVILGSF
jgi:hypothetical protein